MGHHLERSIIFTSRNYKWVEVYKHTGSMDRRVRSSGEFICSRAPAFLITQLCWVRRSSCIIISLSRHERVNKMNVFLRFI